MDTVINKNIFKNYSRFVQESKNCVSSEFEAEMANDDLY